jgi:hypothetical protein
MNDRTNPTERRLERHLRRVAETTTVPASSVVAAKRRAHERTVRRRRAVAGGLAAASVVGVVAGVRVLSEPEPSTIQTFDTPTVDTDDSTAAASTSTPSAAPVAPTTTVVPPDGLAYVDAQLGDPAFVWKVVEPDKDRAISGTFADGTGGTFPALALSTAPGRSNDYDDIELVVWESDDGIEWDQTDLTSPFQQNFWQPQFVDGTVFAVGTAPGVAENTENPLLVGVSSSDAPADDAWTMAELPIDTNEYDSLPMAWTGLDIGRVALGDRLMVSVTPRVDVDVDAAMRANGMDTEASRFWTLIDGGISVHDAACVDPQFPQTTIPGAVPTSTIVDAPPVTVDAVPVTTVVVGAVSPGAGTAVPSGDPSECPSTEYTYEELGVPAETLDAMDTRVTRIFTIDADLNVVEIELPAPGVRLQPFDHQSARFVDVGAFDRYVGEEILASLEVYEYDGTSWSTVAIPNANWAGPTVTLGDVTAGFRYDWNDATFATVDAAGVTTLVDVRPLLPNDEVVVNPLQPLVDAGGRLVTAVQQYPDVIAELGGVEFTVDGVTARKERATSRIQYFDEATGDQIGLPRLITDDYDGSVTVLDENGDEMATFSGEELYQRLDGAVEFPDSRVSSAYQLLTTADGRTFSSEPIAELLGLADADISGVSRISTDGTTVVVAVTLNERHPDDTRKQLVLVGTPLT